MNMVTCPVLRATWCRAIWERYTIHAHLISNKMKRSLLFGLIILAGFSLRAQVAMNLQLPPAGLTIKQQLWNLSLVNSGPPVGAVRIELVITDAATGQPVLTGLSRLFLLPKGAKQLRPSDVAPITYYAGNTGY